MKKLIILLLLSIPIYLSAQNISGEWNGILEQNSGGLAHQYYFSMHIIQDGNAISGYSKINILNRPKEAGRMKFRGTFDGKTLIFEDISIEENTLSYGDWCHKTAKLTFEINKSGFCLSGTWGGKLKDGTICAPGTLKICQLIPIAGL